MLYYYFKSDNPNWRYEVYDERGLFIRYSGRLKPKKEI